MPVYLFTFHAYGSWLPDRRHGYTKRGEGYLPPDPEMAGRYKQNMSETPVSFDHDIQKAMIEEVLVASRFQRFKPEGMGSDATHLHVLESWRDGRSWEQMRRSLRTSLTRKLNELFDKRTWFVESASRKRVRDRGHYDYLKDTYLPDHPGWKWCPERALYLYS